MTPGGYVSAAGHVLLFVAIFWGPWQTPQPMPFEVVEVTAVSSAEYAAMVQRSAPQAETEAAVAPEPPPAEAEAPEPPAPEPEPEPEPEPPPAPEPEPQPEPAPPPPEPAPEPEPEPAPPPPPPPSLDPPAPPPSTELASTVRPVPRPAPRVAPEAAPPPEAEIAPEIAEAAEETLEPTPEPPPEEPPEAAAPEEATTEIVTEAEEPTGAVEVSRRPESRPVRRSEPEPEVAEAEPEPEPAAEEEPAEEVAASDPEPEPAPEEPVDTAEGVDDALAAALASASSGEARGGAAQEGPPMTEGELGDLRRAISGCWIVDVGSEASTVSVTIAFEMGQDRRVAGDVRLVSASGGSAAAQEAAFQAARRAVLRCQSEGYPLPPEKFDTWRQMELTFDPSQMALR